MIQPSKQVIYSSAALFACLVFFESTNIDLFLQSLFYDNDTHSWILNQPPRFIRFLFYDGIKKLLVIFALSILLALILFPANKTVRTYRKGLVIVLLSLLIVPSVTGILKATTNVGCPRDIKQFSGTYPYVRLFESYPQGTQPDEPLRCFPAGHASGGFALMSLYFLFSRRENRKCGLLTGITLGWLMGGYKMLIGDHFFSHTVISMLLAWLLINLITMLLSLFLADASPHIEQVDRI